MSRMGRSIEPTRHPEMFLLEYFVTLAGVVGVLLTCVDLHDETM